MAIKSYVSPFWQQVMFWSGISYAIITFAILLTAIVMVIYHEHKKLKRIRKGGDHD